MLKYLSSAVALSLLLLQPVQASSTDLIQKVLADATYEQLQGYNKGINHCYDIEFDHPYYKKYKPIAKDEGIAEKIELYIDSRCELGYYMRNNPKYNYKAVYSIQHPREMVYEILHKNKYGDTVTIGNWRGSGQK